MKKLGFLFAIAFIGITLTMIFLLRRGVIVRPQPLIKPTVVQADFSPVPEHVFMRLFPDLQASDVVIWRLDLDKSEQEKLLSGVTQQVEKTLQRKVQYQSVADDISSCQSMCWIITSPETTLESLKAQLKSLNKKWITVRNFEYENVTELTDECDHQKFLDENCLLQVSLRSVRKKLKDPEARYFFMQKYLDQDFYLFIKKN